MLWSGSHVQTRQWGECDALTWVWWLSICRSFCRAASISSSACSKFCIKCKIYEQCVGRECTIGSVPRLITRASLLQGKHGHLGHTCCSMSLSASKVVAPASAASLASVAASRSDCKQRHTLNLQPSTHFTDELHSTPQPCQLLRASAPGMRECIARVTCAQDMQWVH